MGYPSKALDNGRTRATVAFLAAAVAQILFVFAVLMVTGFDQDVMVGSLVGALAMTLVLAALIEKRKLTLQRVAILAALSSVTYIVFSVMTAEIWGSAGISIDPESLGARLLFSFMVFGDAWASFVLSFLACWVVLAGQESD